MSTPQERLFGGYYNSAGFSGANPGGLANGGHVQNFPAALLDLGTVAQAVGVQSIAAAGAAAATGADRSAVAADRAVVQQLVGNLPAGVVTQGQDLVRAGGAGGNGSVALNRGGPTFTGFVEFRNAAGVRYGYIGTATTDDKQISFIAENGGGFSFAARAKFGGFTPFDPGNDGSGSGLDADFFRGRALAADALADTVPQRSSDGSCVFKTLYLAAGGGINFAAINATMNVRDSTSIGLNSGLYLSGTLSANVVTERSDRRLKRDVSDLGPVDRLRPRRFIMKDTGERRIGFIAQEVVEVCPMAVRLGSHGPETTHAMLEVSPMALIAHLARQLNDALDRLDVLEAAR